jgi:Tfp pilus assembly protein PilN
MIKINLLGVAPPPSKKVSGPPAPVAFQAAMFIGAMVVCFAIVGVIYKVWSNQVDMLGKELARQKVRQTELAAVKAQNEKYQQRLKDLETRINTIQALQNSRTGPVELMTSLGNVVNKVNEVYLYTATPAGDHLELKGQAATVNAMADFMADLKNSGSFDNVQLEQFFQDDLKDRLNYKFTLGCQFKSSTGGISPTSGGPPAGVTPTGGVGPGATPPIGPDGKPVARPPQHVL